MESTLGIHKEIRRLGILCFRPVASPRADLFYLHAIQGPYSSSLGLMVVPVYCYSRMCLMLQVLVIGSALSFFVATAMLESAKEWWTAHYGRMG